MEILGHFIESLKMQKWRMENIDFDLYEWSAISNGGSWLSVSNTKKIDGVINGEITNNDYSIVGSCSLAVSDDFTKSINLIPHLSVYLYLFQTILIGYNFDYLCTLHPILRDHIYEELSSDILSFNKSSKWTAILSIGDYKDSHINIGIRDNSLFFTLLSVLSDDDFMYLILGDSNLLYCNAYGAYINLQDNKKIIGGNILKLLRMGYDDEFMRIYNGIIGIDSKMNVFLSVFIMFVIEAIGLYMIIEIVYHKDLEIFIRLHQYSCLYKSLDNYLYKYGN
jgi:hypothetical protein